MTLGEYARATVERVIKQLADPNMVNEFLRQTAANLAWKGIPRADQQWFWREVTDQLSAHRELADTGAGADGLMHAHNQAAYWLHVTQDKES